MYTQSAIEVFDHDWKSLASGVVIPHGLYDLTLNIGYIQIGTSHDTGEFACDSIRYWWEHYGAVQYPTANSILLLCDGGGSNSSRQYLFKQDLQALVNDLGIEIRIAHYPPYTSKYNPPIASSVSARDPCLLWCHFREYRDREGPDGKSEDANRSESVYYCIR